ncbi:hypothetical protein EXIGLDRAFT_585596, partial [Exidia glandulosa HHB12029]
MPEKVARIRPLEHRDAKTARLFAGRSVMEMLATANNHAYINPWVLAVWVALGSCFMAALGWWPRTDLPGAFHYFGYLRPVPAFAVVAFPIMLAIDWNQRWQFEDLSTARLKEPDLLDPATFYSSTRSPASGAFVFEWDGRPIGLVAIDASSDGDKKPKTSSTATIRLLYAEAEYRVPPASIQDELVRHAAHHAFSTKPQVEKIRMRVCPGLCKHVHSALKNAGFKTVSNDKTLGLLRWPQVWMELTREGWE